MVSFTQTKLVLSLTENIIELILSQYLKAWIMAGLQYTYSKPDPLKIVRELTTLWAFPLHVYLYKNYNPNHKWEITTLRTLHDLEDQGVMSHYVTYPWQSYHII
jgi:hypothetical protein